MVLTLRYILVSILLSFGSFTILGQSEKGLYRPNLKIEHSLIELERQLSDALAKQDPVVLDRLWNRDLVFTFPDGTVSSKAERLAAQKPATQSGKSDSRLAATNDLVKVHVYRNMAIVTVLTTWKGKSGSQEFISQFQATHVWIKQNGRWELMVAHVSQVKK